MLRALLFVSLLAFTPVVAVVAADAQETNKLAAPAGWVGEVIQLPPPFAPDMKLKGREQIRFAPGMMKSGSKSFFSYAFVFELEEKPELTDAVVQAEFLKYYRGLCKAVLRGQRPDVDPSKFTLKLKRVAAKSPPKSAAKKNTGPPAHYRGVLDWVEPFVTKKPQKLNLDIRTWKRGGRSYLFASVSPFGREQDIWKQLDKIRKDHVGSNARSQKSASSASSAWPRWRGPADSGSTERGAFPVQFTEQNQVWRAALPGRGCSTPIIWRQNVYLTAPVDGKDALLSYDDSGKQRWQAVFGPEDGGKHRNGSGCNASPVTDGDGVFVYFKSGTLAAVDLDGQVRWQTNLVERFGKVNLFWDHGTSPVLTKKHVIMARMHRGESWLAAFDKQSGRIAWKVARNYKTPVECDHGYSTPLVIQHNGKEALLVWGAEHLTIHDAKDGKVAWSCGNFNPDGNRLWPAIATPVIVGDVAVVAYGRNDRGKPTLHGVRLKGSGDVTDSGHLWKRNDIGTFVPSPVAYKGRVYLVGDRGRVVCLDPASGKTVWQDRFPKNRAAFYASPLIANGKLYAPREDGVVFVAEVSDAGFKLLSENNMRESVIGSPVPVGNRLFLRGDKHLFCYGP